MAASVVLVIANAAVTGDAAIHFMVDEWPEILVAVSAFFASVSTIGVPTHLRHILQMTLPSLFTDWAIMGVVGHQ